MVRRASLEERLPEGQRALLTYVRWFHLPEPISELVFDGVRDWRFDAAYPEQRVAVEVDGGVFNGGRHVRGKGYEDDCEKLNAAAAQGWLVLRVTPGMLERDPAQIIDWLRRCLRSRGLSSA